MKASTAVHSHGRAALRMRNAAQSSHGNMAPLASLLPCPNTPHDTRCGVIMKPTAASTEGQKRSTRLRVNTKAPKPPSQK